MPYKVVQDRGFDPDSRRQRVVSTNDVDEKSDDPELHDHPRNPDRVERRPPGKDRAWRCRGHLTGKAQTVAKPAQQVPLQSDRRLCPKDTHLYQNAGKIEDTPFVNDKAVAERVEERAHGLHAPS